MTVVKRILLVFAGLLLLPLPHSSSIADARPIQLSLHDRQIGLVATRLAGSSPRRALSRLRQDSGVAQAQLGPDGQTIDVHFRDGAELVILPRTVSVTRLAPRAIQLRIAASNSTGTSGRAIVMEPFADQLHLGSAAGQPEVDALTHAGFQVDVLRNSAVTVEAMEHLADYSVVYMLTHSGPLPGGDAFFMTDTTNNRDYTQLYAEHSLQQGSVAGDATGTLYNGIRAKFITQHVGTFPNSSIMFINGCSVLSAPLFWQALRQQNVSSLLSWDGEADSAVAELDGQYVIDQLTKGSNVLLTLALARAQGYATSLYGGKVINLSFLGDGDATLAKALAGATPTPTLEPSLPATTTPTPVTKKKPVHCKHGKHLVKGKCKKRK